MLLCMQSLSSNGTRHHSTGSNHLALLRLTTTLTPNLCTTVSIFRYSWIRLETKPLEDLGT